MDASLSNSCTAFAGNQRIAAGDTAEVALGVKAVVDRGEQAPVLVFDDASGEQVELDLRGTKEDVLGRLSRRPTTLDAAGDDASGEGLSRGPGRPRLGVVGREVTLLPRHWEWLSGQPGGASVALRKLVEQARKANETRDRVRRSQEAAYRFMSALAGNRQGFEEAARALFAGDRPRLESQISDWPPDIRAYLLQLARQAVAPQGEPS